MMHFLRKIEVGKVNISSLMPILAPVVPLYFYSLYILFTIGQLGYYNIPANYVDFNIGDFLSSIVVILALFYLAYLILTWVLRFIVIFIRNIHVKGRPIPNFIVHTMYFLLRYFFPYYIAIHINKDVMNNNDYYALWNVIIVAIFLFLMFIEITLLLFHEPNEHYSHLTLRKALFRTNSINERMAYYKPIHIFHTFICFSMAFAMFSYGFGYTWEKNKTAYYTYDVGKSLVIYQNSNYLIVVCKKNPRNGYKIVYPKDLKDKMFSQVTPTDNVKN